MPIDDILRGINDILVYWFGSVLAIAFCGNLDSRKKRLRLGAVLIGLLAVQGILYSFCDVTHIEKLYPLVVHLPLILALWRVCQSGFFWSIVSVLTAYLCCQPRRWLASIALLLPGGGTRAFYLTSILLTLPLLLFFVRAIAPGVRSIGTRALRTQIEFGSLPILYYLYYYVTAIYTNWLDSGMLAVVDFMPALCCVLYLAFVVRFEEVEWQWQALEADRDTLNFQVTQSMRELEQLRHAQRETAALRHDMRHHLQYLSACLAEQNTAAAQEYLQSVCHEIDAQKIVRYCENEPVNLILSAFAGRAEAAGVQTRFHAALPEQLSIPANDLCVILSNALENAVHAAADGPCPREVTLESYEKQGRFYFQISNTCAAAPAFAEGCPVAVQPGHGQGTKSICMLLTRYHGLYSYTMEEERLVFRFSF